MIVKISNVNDINKYNISSFKSKSNNSNRIIEKRNYIDAKTQGIEDFALITLIVGLLLDNQDVVKTGKFPTHKKWGTGLIIISAISMVIGLIKKIQLSKLYDKENV